MITKADVPSSSSSPFRKLTYDVFLSFRGEDTRQNFTDHLYTALKQKGIFTFRDDEELDRGESISSKLYKAIEESRYVIVVLSPNYANSSWCLDEIAKVVECIGQAVVLPVFYHVDPSDVRKQTGKYFGKAFEKHQEDFELTNPDKIKRWRDALSQLSNLSGWHVQQNGSEARVIQDIVGKIFTELNLTISLSEGLVGMDSHLNEVLSYLDIGCSDVRIIGISGMGGIGKTTIAQVVSERVQAQFEACSFLENVREVIEKQGAVHLQQQLLSNLLNIDVNLQNSKMGKNIMGHRLSTKMVLIVLDDVDHEEQLEALCDRRWFGPGSRIIITSRDEHLLSAFGADEVYTVNPLTNREALELFSFKAFKKDQQVGEDLLKLSNEFLKYADGHPLAIKVVASSLRGRSVKLWPSALERLKKSPERKITNVLKVSFDGLEETEKKMFLDIACFFKGENLNRVTRILKGSDQFCPDIDVQVLLDKSLVTLFGTKLWMHDLMQELGWEIVRQECRDEVGKRSRLWLPNEIIHVLERNKGTSTVQSIFLKGPTKDDVVHLINDPFSNMDRLRLLKIKNVKFSGSITYLSNELQFLLWHECPLESFPSNFQPDNLVEIHMHSSRIKHLWRGGKGWRMLQFIDLRESQYLMSTPDFTEVPHLEKLDLQDCTSLVDVHPSLGFLKKLVFLNMKNCKSVESIPPLTNLESLEFFILSLCSRVKKFPEIKGNMSSLLELHLDGTSIEELPPSVERLTGLTMLNLNDCKHLLHLPSNIQCLTSLKSLYLTGCSNLEEMPENLNRVECLEKLYIGGTAIRDLTFLVGMKNLQYLSCRGCKGPESCKGQARTSLLFPASLSTLTRLIDLDLSDCNLMDGAIPSDLNSLIFLRELDLSGNGFVRLPAECISQLPKLEKLNLSNCRQLQQLPNLPSSLHIVTVRDCTSLMDHPKQSKVLTSVKSGITLFDTSGFTSTLTSWRNLCNPEGTGNMDFSTKADGDTEWKQLDDLPLPISFVVKNVENLKLETTHLFSYQIDNEIPEWFSTVSSNNFIKIPIPPNLTDDNKWKGVALCAVLSFKGHTAFSLVQSDSEISSYFHQCSVETDVFRMEPLVELEKDISSMRSSSHKLLIIYLPSAMFSKELNISTIMSALFETNNPLMEVQKCGIRLVYEQDDGWYTEIFSCTYPVLLNEDQCAILDSGWLSQVDDCWKLETRVPLCDQDSTILLRNNLESVLPGYIEGLNRHATYKFNLSGCPSWFHRYRAWPGSYMEVELPRDLHRNKKWKGFSVYTSIAEEYSHSIKVEEHYLVYIQLKVGESYVDLSQRLKYVVPSEEHHQLLVVYIPREEIPEVLLQSSPSTMDIFIRTVSPHVEIQRNGIRIVYQEDLQGFVQTIIQCMERENSLPVYDKLLGGQGIFKTLRNWINLIGLRGRHSEGTSSNQDSSIQREREFQLLSQKYRNWDWSVSSSPFFCLFYGAEILKWKWFTRFNEGNSAEIQLPQNLFEDASWLGIAVCAFFWRSHEHPNIISPDSEFNVLDCSLSTDVASGGLFDVKTDNVFGKLQPWEVAADHTWFLFVPSSRKYSKFWRHRNLVRVTYQSSSPSLILRSCAIRLVFKKDVEDLVQALTLCELP